MIIPFGKNLALILFKVCEKFFDGLPIGFLETLIVPYIFDLYMFL